MVAIEIAEREGSITPPHQAVLKGFSIKDSLIAAKESRPVDRPQDTGHFTYYTGLFRRNMGGLSVTHLFNPSDQNR